MKKVIAYVSTVSAGIETSEIKQLFHFVNQKNDALDITGALLFSEGNFLQILEGHTKTITPLFEVIKKDPRHHTLIKIFEKESEKSFFEKYTSSFSSFIQAEESSKVKHFLEEMEKENHSEANALLYLAKKFIDLPF